MLAEHLNSLIAIFGSHIYFIIFLLVFAQTGILFLFFIPGNALLFALGALTVTENAQLDLKFLILSVILGGVLGNNLGYRIGSKFGKKFLKKNHFEMISTYFQKHGNRTVLMAPIIPNVRTLAPLFAGLIALPLKQFQFYCVLGVTIWASIFLVGGAWVGAYPAIKENFEYIILGAILISIAPALFDYFKKVI